MGCFGSFLGFSEYHHLLKDLRHFEFFAYCHHYYLIVVEFHQHDFTDFDLVQWSVPLGYPYYFLKIQGREGGYFRVVELEYIQYPQYFVENLKDYHQTDWDQNSCSMIRHIDHHLL